MSLTTRVLNYLSGLNRVIIWVITVLCLLVLGTIDYVTGSLISITYFYLLPVSLASWGLGKRAGRFIALSAALIMQAGPVYGQADPSALLTFWNFVVRLAVFLVVADLISESHQLLIHQTQLSRTDPLTGILNRRAFEEVGEAAVQRMHKVAAPLTLAFLDIDDFKAVNDSSGHAVGDELLLSVAQLIRSQLWGADSVARLGGDEYGILLPQTGTLAARKVMTRLRRHLLDMTSEAGWPVSVSIGVVTCTTPPPDLEHVVRLADQLMYAAKRAGKDRIEYGLYPSQGDASGEPAVNTPLARSS